MIRRRVLQVVYGLQAGGAERVAALLAANLDADAFDVEVLSLTTDGPIGDLLRERSVRTHVLSKRPGLDLAAARRFAAFLRDGRHDVVHAHNQASNRWAALCGFLAGSPAALVVSEHNPRSGAARIDRLLPLRALVGLCNSAIVGVSEQVTASYRDVDPFSRARYRTIANGTEAAAALDGAGRAALRAEFGVPAGAALVVAVGNLRPPKAHSDLVDAMTHLTDRVPEIHAIVVGEGPLRADLESRSRAAGVADRIRWVGYRTDVARFLGAADLFVMCSRSEGMPLAILEAMSAGVPIVATDVGGVQEVVRDGATGRLVPPADPEALAAGIVRALEEASWSAAMASSARRAFDHHYSIEAMARSFAGLYDELVPPTRARTAGSESNRSES